MQHNITAPADVINFIEKYLDYNHLYTSTMYKLKNTALLNTKMVADAMDMLLKEEMIHENNVIKFFDIKGIKSKFYTIVVKPTIIFSEKSDIKASGARVQGSVLHGDVEFNFTKSLVLNQTSFNVDATVIINGRILTKEELKCISGNVFDLCTANITFELSTIPTGNASEIYEILSNTDIWELVTEGYDEGLEDIKTWSYNKAAYVPELQKCVSPVQPKVFEIDALNVGTQKFLCDESFTIPLHEDL